MPLTSIVAILIVLILIEAESFCFNMERTVPSASVAPSRFA